MVSKLKHSVLPTLHANKIIYSLKKKGLHFSNYNDELIIHTLENLNKKGRNSCIDELKKKGKVLAENIFNDSKNSTVSKIHIEISWYNKLIELRHAMALIYNKDNYTLEFFDSLGFDSKKPLCEYDWSLFIYFNECALHLSNLFQKKIIFKNVNFINMNYDNYCNTWCIFYHYLNHSTEDTINYIYYLQKNKKEQDKIISKLNYKFIKDPKEAINSLLTEINNLKLIVE